MGVAGDSSVGFWVVAGKESIFDVESDPVALVSWNKETDCIAEATSL